jgi:hypothetical protein
MADRIGWGLIGASTISAIFTIVVGLVLVAPVLIAAIQVGHEAIKLVNWAAAAGHTGMPLPDWLIQLPVLGRYLSSWWQANPVTAGDLLGRINQDTVVVWTGTLGAIPFGAPVSLRQVR